MDEKESDELSTRVEGLGQKLREGEDKDADDAGDADDRQDKQADKLIKDVEKYLGELTSKGEPSADGGQRIGAALAEVRVAL